MCSAEAAVRVALAERLDGCCLHSNPHPDLSQLFPCGNKYFTPFDHSKTNCSAVLFFKGGWNVWRGFLSFKISQVTLKERRSRIWTGSRDGPRAWFRVGPAPTPLLSELPSLTQKWSFTVGWNLPISVEVAGTGSQGTDFYFYFLFFKCIHHQRLQSPR